MPSGRDNRQDSDEQGQGATKEDGPAATRPSPPLALVTAPGAVGRAAHENSAGARPSEVPTPDASAAGASEHARDEAHEHGAPPSVGPERGGQYTAAKP